MRYIKINGKVILFSLLLLIPERLFFLLNEEKLQNVLHMKYWDFECWVYFVLFIYLFIRYQRNNEGIYYFLDNMFFIIPLSIVASIVPHILFGQSIMQALWIQRYFMIMICTYYVFRTIIVKNIFTPDYIWSCFYKFSFIHTFLIILQHAVANYIQILNVRYTQRFGIRITTNYTFSTILLVGSLALYFTGNSKKEKVISAIGLIMSYYHCVVVSQTRIVMIAYGILTIIIALFSRNRVLKKVTYLFVLVGVLLILIQSDLGQYLMSAVFDSSTDPSAQIREVGKDVYLYEIAKSPIVGRGYPVGTSYEAYKAAGLYDQIYLNDNGIYGFAYIYGLLGLVWYAWLTIKMIVCSINSVKKGDFRFMLFTLFMQIICVNIIWWYWTFSFCVCLSMMLALMEEYNNNISMTKVRFYF